MAAQAAANVGWEPASTGSELHTDGLRTHTGVFVIDGDLTVTRSLTLPPASITTDELAPYAAQQLAGSFVDFVSWTLPQAYVWLESPIQVSLALSGAPIRIEFNVPLSCATKGQHLMWGITNNGTLIGQALGAIDAPEADFGMMAVGIYYYLPTGPGAGRLGLGLHGPAGSQILDGLPSTFYVTEQKR